MKRLAVAAVFLLCLVGFAMHAVVRQLDKLEAQSHQRLIALSTSDMVNRLTMLAEDNGLWDEAARNIYSRDAAAFAQATWGSPTGMDTLYSDVAVVDSSGKIQLAYSSAKPVQSLPVNLQAGDAKALIESSRKSGSAVGGMVQSPGGLKLIGVAPVLPTSRHLSPLVPQSGPSSILFIRSFGAEELANIAERLQISDLEIAPPIDDIHQATLFSPTDKPIAALRWRPTDTYNHVIASALPWIGLALLLMLAIIAVLVSKNERTKAALHKLATTDPVSGHPNLRKLEEDLADCLDQELALVACRIQGEDNALIRAATAIALNMRATNGDLRKFRAVIENGLVVFAWPGAADDRQIISKINKASAQFAEMLADLPGAGSLNFAFGVARKVSPQESLISIARRANFEGGLALEKGNNAAFYHDDAQVTDNGKSIQSVTQDIRSGKAMIAFEPITLPNTRRISGFEPVLMPADRHAQAKQSRPWLNHFSYDREVRELLTLVITQSLEEAINWPQCNLILRIPAGIANHPRFTPWLKSVVDDACFPPQRLEVVIVTKSIRDSIRSQGTISALSHTTISTGLELADAAISVLGFLAETPSAFLSIRLPKDDGNKQHNIEIEGLIAAANTCGIPLLIADVCTYAQHELATRAQSCRVQGNYYVPPIAAANIPALLTATLPKPEPIRIRLAG